MSEEAKQEPTPGPWKVTGEDPFYEFQPPILRGWTNCVGDELVTCDNPADMRLILAAPQLLAACEAALADSVDHWGEGWSLDSPAGVLHEQLRAAIAAAKGENNA